uniref:DUF1036 domain-containing protein n=1 Tax=Candidatus Electronema sp. TaxID=2698783 RepID=UPI0040566788
MKISNHCKILFFSCAIFASVNQAVADIWGDMAGLVRQHRPQPIKQNILITFHNQNNKSLQAALRYQTEDGNWITGGWYKINPNEKKNIAKTNNAIIYVYAESIAPKDSRMYWNGTDRYYPIKGSDEPYGFKEYNATKNELIVQFPSK